jgi:hypothetical protein
MRRVVAVTLLVLSLAACSQSPFVPPLDPTGSWSGTWTGNVIDRNLSVRFTRASGGWQGVFRTNNVEIVTVCGNPEDEGPQYLLCGAWNAVEVIVWEGNVSGSTWSGVWTYVGSSANLGGSFTLHRN